MGQFRLHRAIDFSKHPQDKESAFQAHRRKHNAQVDTYDRPRGSLQPCCYRTPRPQGTVRRGTSCSPNA